MGHLSSHIVAALASAAVMLQVVRYASRRSREEQAKMELDSTSSRGVH